MRHRLTLTSSPETKNIVTADTRNMAIDYFSAVMQLDRSTLLKIYLIRT